MTEAELQALTPEQKIQEFKKCTSDPIYFIKNYCYIPHQTYGEILMGDYLYPKQEMFIKLMNDERFVITNKTRQCGFSTAIGCYALWFALFHINKNIVIVSITDEHSMEFLKNYVTYPYDRLPEFLKSKKLTRTQNQNMHQMGFYTGSKIRCTSGKNAGRGSSNYMVIVDEVGFLQESIVKDIWSSVFPTIITGKEGKVILNSTSSAVGTWYFDRWNLSKNNQSEFKAIEVDWWEVPYLAADSDYENRMRRELTPLSRFRREIMREFIVDEEPFIPIDFQDSMREDPPIRTDFLRPEDYIPPEEMNPNEFKNTEGFDAAKNYIKGLWIWVDPMPKRSYILSADVAEGSGEDNSTIQVFDSANMEQVAEFIAKIDTFTFSDIIIKLAFFYNKAHVIVESNAAGNAVVSRLEKTFQYENLYYRQIQKGLYAPGFRTTSGNRHDVMTSYYKAIVNFNWPTHSERLKRETRSLITKRNKVQAAQGVNDDLIMAYSIGAYLIQQNAIQSVVYEMNYDKPYGARNITTQQSIASIKEYLEENTDYTINNSDYYRYKWMY